VGRGHLYLNGGYLPAARHGAGWLTNTRGRGERSSDGVDGLCSSRELTARPNPHPQLRGRTAVTTAPRLLCRRPAGTPHPCSPSLQRSLAKQKTCTQEEPNPSPWLSAASGKAVEELGFRFRGERCHGAIPTDPQQGGQDTPSSEPLKQVVANCANRI